MVSILLSITFGCGVFIAAAHVINVRFVAPIYDVIANLIAFLSAAAASALLEHWIPTAFAATAVFCWLVLARRTLRALHHDEQPTG